MTALQTGHGAQNFARHRRDDGDDHDGDNDAARQHADAVNRPFKQRQKTKRFLQPRKQMVAQPRYHYKNSPQTKNDTRHGGEEFNEHRKRLAQPERGKFGEINGGGDADGHGDEQRDGGRNERAKDERHRAVLFVDRVPVAAGEKMPAEPAQGDAGAVRQLVTDEHDEREDGQRHEQREPLEGAVAEVRPGFGRCRIQFRLLFRRSRGNEAQASPRNYIQSLLTSAPTGLKSKGRRAGGTTLFVRLTPIK